MHHASEKAGEVAARQIQEARNYSSPILQCHPPARSPIAYRWLVVRRKICPSETDIELRT